MKNEIYSAFDEIKAGQQIKTDTKYFIDEYYRKKENNYYKTRGRYSFAVAVIAVVTASVFAFVSYITPVSAISLDGDDSSVELKINSFNKVVDVSCFGCDDEEIFNLKNMSYEEAVAFIIEENKTQEKDNLVLTVNCENAKKGKRIADSLSHCSESKVSVGCHSADTVKQAHSCGLSTGKYLVYLELEKAGIEISPEEANELSMKELRSMLESVSSENKNEVSQNTSDEAFSKHNGQGLQHHSAKHGNHN